MVHHSPSFWRGFNSCKSLDASDVGSVDVPVLLCFCCARDDAAPQCVLAAEVLFRSVLFCCADDDGDLDVARARGGFDRTGRADLNTHGVGLGESAGELLVGLTTVPAAVAPHGIRALVVASVDR